MTTARVLFLRIMSMYRHAPGLAVVTLAAPLGMMLLFGFVFGGALSGGESVSAYRSYLTPGVLVLVSAMGLVATASNANSDLRSGLTDRLRVLPVRPVVLPVGHAVAETLAGIVGLVGMGAVGYAAGWRIEAPTVDVVTAVVLLCAFRFAACYLGILLGSVVRDENMLQQIAPLIFGTIMLSNVFVPTETMPAALGAIAEWNPVSSVVQALRELFGAEVSVGPESAWPMHHPVAAAFCWITVILLVSVPLAGRQYSSGR